MRVNWLVIHGAPTPPLWGTPAFIVTKPPMILLSSLLWLHQLTITIVTKSLLLRHRYCYMLVYHYHRLSLYVLTLIIYEVYSFTSIKWMCIFWVPLFASSCIPYTYSHEGLRCWMTSTSVDCLLPYYCGDCPCSYPTVWWSVGITRYVSSSLPPLK